MRQLLRALVPIFLYACATSSPHITGVWVSPPSDSGEQRIEFTADGRVVFDESQSDYNPASWSFDPEIRILAIAVRPGSDLATNLWHAERGLFQVDAKSHTLFYQLDERPAQITFNGYVFHAPE